MLSWVLKNPSYKHKPPPGLTRYSIKGCGETATNLILSKLLEEKYYDLMERAEMARILDEHKLDLTGIVDETTACKLGKILGVDALIFGTIYTEVTDIKGREKVEKRIGTGKYREVEKRHLFTGKKYKTR